MQTNILSPKDLFQKTVLYTIPTFQRPYVWNQDEQWEPLWQDVQNVAEDYLEKLQLSEHDSFKAEQSTKPHFLGAVVLQQVPTAASDIEQREVIDGQQRVTTLQLLLDAIQEICDERKLRQPAIRLSKLVTNDADLIGDQAHHELKLWPTRGDREAFWHAMRNGLAVNDFEDSRIVQAHEFFQGQVRKWLDDSQESELDSVRALETAVTTMLQMVVIDLGTTDDPNVIFETLNARGTPLEQSDLIKNFVMAQYSADENARSSIWTNLDDQWWRENVRQGRLLRPRLDMLFNYWLAMCSGSEVSPSKVFLAFRENAEGRQIRDVMDEVQGDFSRYRRFETEERTEEEDLFRYRTTVMQAGVITPVMLMLLSANHAVRMKAFHALESYLIRRMLCRQTTKDYNRLTLDIATRLRQSGLETADKIVASHLREQTAYSREWPSDARIMDALENSPLYRLLTRGRLRLVLEGIESRLRSSKAEQHNVPKDLTIEHLMPISWESNWPLPDGIAPESRVNIVHTIGNLTLVTQKLNSAMSNAAWKKKQGELLKHSVMNLNSELAGEPTWDEETIRNRSKRMAELVTECWPGPDSEEWS